MDYYTLHSPLLDMNDFVQNDSFYLFNWNLNKVLDNISGIFEIKRMADHILEMAGLGGYFVIVVS